MGRALNRQTFSSASLQEVQVDKRGTPFPSTCNACMRKVLYQSGRLPTLQQPCLKGDQSMYCTAPPATNSGHSPCPAAGSTSPFASSVLLCACQCMPSFFSRASSPLFRCFFFHLWHLKEKFPPLAPFLLVLASHSIGRPLCPCHCMPRPFLVWQENTGQVFLFYQHWSAPQCRRNPPQNNHAGSASCPKVLRRKAQRALLPPCPHSAPPAHALNATNTTNKVPKPTSGPRKEFAGVQDYLETRPDMSTISAALDQSQIIQV